MELLSQAHLKKLVKLASTPARERWVSRLSLRIFAVNVMALVVLAFGLLYISRYQQELVQGELDGLERQATIYAGALAEAARYSSTIKTPNLAMGEMVKDSLSRERTRNMVRRLGETTINRIRVYSDEGRLMGDSDILGGAGGVIHATPLPPMKPQTGIGLDSRKLRDIAIDLLPSGLSLKEYPDITNRRAARRGENFPNVADALDGRVSSNAWTTGPHKRDIILSAAVPIQHLKQVLGVVYVTRDGTAIADAIRQMKLDIIKLFMISLTITFILSSYLAAGIAKPLKKLARAADQVRRGLSQAEIPNLTDRHDEIGDLSLALRDMTDALAARLDSIERFAADVAHELKNPLTSIRSAFETVQMVKDEKAKDKLTRIILHDLQRMDRLISDISAASRLDAELSRENMALVDLRPLLTNLCGSYEAPLDRVTDASNGNARVILDLPPENEILIVHGLEGRLAQVFRNLIDNALSFSPEGMPVKVHIVKDISRRQIKVLVEDNGPGIPEGKLTAIFERFYSERPQGEAFGKHSGLGLSIAKQIMDAHKGSIYAENINDETGSVKGARMTVVLNALG